MNKLLMLCLLALSMVVNARELPDELVEDGKITGQGHCAIPDLSSRKLDCFQIKMKGEMYVALGVIDGNDFYVHYIGKLVNGQYVIVWTWKRPKGNEST